MHVSFKLNYIYKQLPLHTLKRTLVWKNKLFRYTPVHNTSASKANLFVLLLVDISTRNPGSFSDDDVDDDDGHVLTASIMMLQSRPS